MAAYATTAPGLDDPSPVVERSLPRHHTSSQPAHGEAQFYSTTTAPVRDRDHERAAPADPRSSKGSTPSSPGSSGSVLDRGRPQAPHQSRQQQQQRPSSFFGVEAEAGQHDALAQGGALGAPPLAPAVQGAAARGRAVDGGQGAPVGPTNSSFRVDTAIPREQQGVDGLATATNPQPLSQADGHAARRSSFYGLDAARPSPVPAGVVAANASREGSSPGRDTPSTTSHHNPSSGSGSGSYSSDVHPHPRMRYSNAPYATSRSASLYGAGSGEGGEGGSVPPPPAQLLDQSHLRVGSMASLLSHDKTLELYRQNAKKTNDPDIQYEFATFTMDVVADLEQSTLMARAARGEDAPPLPQEAEARQKQQALVAESIALLNRLATRGHVPSCYFLADCYTQGIGTSKGKRDYDKAFPLFHTAGKHGHAAGSFRTAQCLEHGWGTRKDWSKAVSFYRRAAVLSHTGAMHRLGLAELNGELGLSKRAKDGVQWLTRAAELADQVDPPQPQSLHELAVLHEQGIDNVVFQDEDYAAELLARAAELQYAPSAYKLGECYEYGKMGYIAAQQNHAAACFALTAWYLVGSPGILPQSDTEAYLWAKKAAEQGLAKAEYAVGYFSEVGIGTYRDERDALEWFRRAASHGDKRAMDRLRLAGQPLPPVVGPDAASQPQRRPSPVHGGVHGGARPGLPSTESHMSGLHLPAKTRRLSSSRILLRKENASSSGGAAGSLGSKKKSALNLSASGGAFGGELRTRTTSAGALPAADRKAKGKEKALPDMPSLPPPNGHPHGQGMPPMTRQRSYSQPEAVMQPMRPLDYNLRPLPAGAGAPQPLAVGGPGAHSPLALGGATNALQPPYVGEYGGHDAGVGVGSPARRAPPSAGQVRMPARQGPTDSPQLGSDEVERKKQERDKVLQRRKNAGEDKDCVVM
ncbi:uncharacterized protein RHOBADRAFT_52570 [Rhodotorula graminis WP1]|uniref:Chitin synthase activator n=1 Tax=Rhodotorula graminis (strain WP1) TaxID=578459 RepID=A0A194S7L4_RHOGW|nr:uncharacterized protein RHOBADRAFT_52570 [Rhodotorula graminis WP1]KPV76582.1 hypothetical protein RHOBADRAFT_52570 [Rhodotorula graminis WP1]